MRSTAHRGLEDNMITVRKITDNDLPTLQSWAKARGCVLLPNLLSPHGFLACDDDKPILCAWAALTMDVPIVQIDHVYLPRRFNLNDLRVAWTLILNTIRAWVKIINDLNGYGYSLLEIVMNPVMEFEAQRAGGIVSQRMFKKCHYII